MSSEQTPFLKIDYVLQNQSQKEVTINSGFLAIDNSIKSLHDSVHGTSGHYANGSVLVSVNGDGLVLNSTGRFDVHVFQQDEGVFVLSYLNNNLFQNTGCVFVGINGKADSVYTSSVSIIQGMLHVYLFKFLDTNFVPCNVSFSVRYDG